MRNILLILIITMMVTVSLSSQTYLSAQESKGLEVGSDAPLFSAIDQNGNLYSLGEALQNGPVVVIFYRGHWCPVCTKHLGQIQDSLHAIFDKGASVVAVSPEKVELLNKTAGKTAAEFTLLHDKGYIISNAFDLTFMPDSMSRVLYNTVLGANLKTAHDDDSQRLPIPATYILGKDGKVLWRHFDPDYKKRASVSNILSNLP